MPSSSANKKTASKISASRASSEKPSSPLEPLQTAELSSRSDSGMKALLLDGVKDIFWAENHLVKALPKMQSATTSTALSTAIGEHLAVTKNQVIRLEKIFDLLGEKVQAKKCDGMEGLSKEGEAIIESTEAGTPARDLGIIFASRKVEHYEIATYTGLANLASTLGLTDVASLLTESLNEETDADATLGGIAETNTTPQSNNQFS